MIDKELSRIKEHIFNEKWTIPTIDFGSELEYNERVPCLPGATA
jgi:hypothetical protein